MTVLIRTGDALSRLRGFPDGSARCCVTSPPYFGLRDYGAAGQIGLEKTPDEYIANLVAVFREVRRVLADDGTLWVVLGDSYAGYHGNKNHSIPTSSTNGWNNGYNENLRTSPIGQCGIKPKDLLMIPARVALALQADGWYLRSNIVWHKPNAMPESVRDRPTSAHESVFLLSRNARYHYDAEAVAEPAKVGFNGSRFDTGKTAARDPSKPPGRPARVETGTRNLRNVWTIPPQPFRGAHFATFPPALVERCILAGSAPGDTVLDPFFGAGTTGLVADRLGRDCVGIEVNPTYVDLAAQRLAATDLFLDPEPAACAAVAD